MSERVQVVPPPPGWGGFTEARRPTGRRLGLIAIVVLVAIVTIGLLTTVTYESVPPDKIGLHYTGGPIDGTHFVEVVQPGTGARVYGLLENMYLIPATQRNYIISKRADEGDQGGTDFISAPSKDRVGFTFEASVYFVVNTKASVLRQFFEEVCLHDACYTDDGWNRMLAQYFRKPLELAIAQEAKKYDQADLYSNPKTLTDMNESVSASLADDINSSIGFPAFCGPDATEKRCTNFRVIIKNPTPPSAVIDAYDATSAEKQKVQVAVQTAQEAIETAKGEARSKEERARGDANSQAIRAQAKALTAEQLDYIRAQAIATCAANDNCTLVVSSGTTGVQINTK